jgi:GMP synthase-like glutamine amidotransferase
MLMKPLRIFRHVANEGPGYLAEFLDRLNVPYQLICIDRGDFIPPSLADTAGLIFMGGPMSVNDPLPWIAQELTLIQRAVAARVPVLGHCLGGQLISKALGGRVTANSVKEIGWLPVQRVESDLAQEWLGDLPAQFEVFHWHGETFTLPPGATPLLRSEHCLQQGFVLGDTLALQCHVEMTAEMVTEWAEAGQHEIEKSSATVQTAQQMTRGLAGKASALQKVAEPLYRRWLKPVLASVRISL